MSISFGCPGQYVAGGFVFEKKFYKREKLVRGIWSPFPWRLYCSFLQIYRLFLPYFLLSFKHRLPAIPTRVTTWFGTLEQPNRLPKKTSDGKTPLKYELLDKTNSIAYTPQNWNAKWGLSKNCLLWPFACLAQNFFLSAYSESLFLLLQWTLLE